MQQLGVLRWVALACVVILGGAPAWGSFATFESGQVRPLALSPDGTRLFAVNTPDNRLEIFDVSGGALSHAGSVPVGMEPVAVAARSDDEVWVVNHLSDSISIVDVSTDPARVVRTLLVGDEPRDIVFAGPTDVNGDFTRAFITTAHRGQNTPLQPTINTILRTEGIGRADVWVFDTTNLGASLEGDPLTTITLFGDTPRALAATADGSTVYAAVFHSGNQTTTVTEGAVCNGGSGAAACNIGDGVHVANGLTGDQVPGGLPAPNGLSHAPFTLGPETGLVVKLDQGTNTWEDQLGRNWTNAVRFDLPDDDVFEIDADAVTPVEVDSFAHVGTVLFNMLVAPNGKIYVTNTEARNEVRFEGPGNSATTVRGHLHEARITVIDGSSVLPRHLNKHITQQTNGYLTTPTEAGVKDKSLATPVGMALAGDGTLYVAAFGSSKVGWFDSAQIENDTFTPDSTKHIEVTGGGPSGLALDEANDRLYVLTRFDNSVKVINTSTKAEIAQHALHNPEPPVVVDGRPFLYDARFTSSNGEASCSSCHVFGDFDSLGWDLGNPDDNVAPSFNPVGPIGSQSPFHPMKGPMTTQTLRGMANHGPMHWRGDRSGGTFNGDPLALDEQLAFEAFNVAFPGLIGRDAGQIPADDMTAFAQFILEVILPPNPIRPLSNQLTPSQANGRSIYLTRNGIDAIATCNGCHELDPAQGFFGANGETTFENETQEFKVAHLSNAYQKVGMFGMPDVPFVNVSVADRQHQGPQIRGFGFLHDGSIDRVFNFLKATVFIGFFSDNERRDMEDFIMAFDTTFAPIVGQQVTLTSTNGAVQEVEDRLDLMIQRATTNFTLVGQPGAKECDLVVKGTIGGEPRGWLLNNLSGLFESDRALEAAVNDATLRALANTAGQELTYTCAPPGSGLRMGLDRDGDGYFDTDEVDAGTDPADASSFPGAPTEQALGAKKLLVKNKNPDDESKNKIVLVAKDGSVAIPAPGSNDDPRCGLDPPSTVKATLAFSSIASGESHSTDLPCGNWKLIGSTTSPKGYKYKDKELDDGTAKIVLWKGGKLLKAVLQGKGPTTLDYDLQIGIAQGTVAATFQSGGSTLCSVCPPFNGKDGSDGKKFLGKDCSAPVSCP